MGDEKVKAIAASAYMPIQAIKPIATNPIQQKKLEKIQVETELRNNLLNNVIDYQKRQNEYTAALKLKEEQDSEEQIKKLSTQIALLGLESTTDPKKIEYGLGILGNLFRYNQFHKTNSFTNDLVYNQKLIRGKAEERLAQLKQGEDVQNGPKSYWGLGFESNSIKQTTKNVAAFEFQKTGERDFLT